MIRHRPYLTPNQIDVLEHVAAGWRAEAIGAASKRSGSTVEGALRNARRFLGAATNSEAVAVALERDLLSRGRIHNYRLLRRVGEMMAEAGIAA